MSTRENRQHPDSRPAPWLFGVGRRIPIVQKFHNLESFHIMNSESKELFEKAKHLIPGGVNSPVRAFRSVGGTPFFTRKAEGYKLTTADGNDLIDYVCTWGPAIHGHNHPRIKEAINKALENGTELWYSRSRRSGDGRIDLSSRTIC